jgi:hypothetical protein
MRSFFCLQLHSVGEVSTCTFFAIKAWHMVPDALTHDCYVVSISIAKETIFKDSLTMMHFWDMYIYIYSWVFCGAGSIIPPSQIALDISRWYRLGSLIFDFSIFIWDHDPQVAHIFEIGGSTTKQIHPRMLVSYLEDFSMVQIQTSWGWWVFDLNICKTTSFCSACQVRVSRF